VLAATLGVTALGAAPSSSEVEVRVFQFKPARFEVQRGTRVQWANRDDVGHTVTAGTPDAPQTAFRVVLEGRGTTGSVQFGEPGTYSYFCERHQHMRGEINVQ
jgi:plastocyanin